MVGSGNCIFIFIGNVSIALLAFYLIRTFFLNRLIYCDAIKGSLCEESKLPCSDMHQEEENLNSSSVNDIH